MRRRTTLALLLVALLVAPSAAVAAVSGEPVLTVQLSENRVTPGEETVLELTLLNRGNLSEASTVNPSFNARVTTARGLTVALGSGDAPIEVLTGRQAVGSLPEGASPPVAFRVVVAENATPGSYDLPVEYEYAHTEEIDERDGSTNATEVNGSDTVTVEIVAGARFEVENASTDVPVGDAGPVLVNVTNVGTAPARDARITVTTENADLTFEGATSATSHAGRWAPGETRTFVFRAAVAENAERRSYGLSAAVEYEDDDGATRRSAPLSFGVTPDPEQSFSVGNASSTLRVGEEGSVEGAVTNDGPRTARNVVVVFEPTNPNVDAVETEYAVGDLAPGESASFSFDAAVPEGAEAGPRQFSVRLRYRNGDGDRRRSDELDLAATVGDARPAFVVSGANATLTAGEDGTLVLEVTNNGDERVTDVSAKLYADAPLSSSDDEAFVASLAPGESAEIEFGASAAGSAMEKSYPVELDFRYEDSEGDTRISDTVRVPVGVTAPADGGPPTALLLAGAALALLALAVGYRYLG